MRKLYLTLLMMVLGLPILFAQIYVTEAGGAVTKDGQTWATAYDNTQLQQAINEAATATVKEVWVAKGIYRPTELLSTVVYTGSSGSTVGTSSDRDKSFILKGGVAVYGGFSGSETSINDRTFSDIFATSYATIPNETILSGDLNNNNIGDFGDAYHVVAARDNADGVVLDGFTIQHGYGSNFDGTTDDGASLHYVEIEGGVRIRRNIGAALMFNSTGTLTFKNLIIKDNQTSNAGGAVRASAVGNTAKFDFENIRFENNTVGSYGGGAVYATGGTATVASSLNFTSCNFINNGGGTTGGGAIFHEYYKLNITNCNFKDNSAAIGGAVRVNSGAVAISKSKFDTNKATSATVAGGGVYITGEASGTIDNSIFYNNESLSTAVNSGAAVYNHTGTSLTITNSTFYANKSASSYGAIGFGNASTTTLNLYNNIFYENKGNYNFDTHTGDEGDVRQGTLATQTYSYNLFQLAISNSGSRTVVSPYYLQVSNPQPLFASTTEGDYNFLWPIEGSFAIDKGDNTLYTNNVSDVITAKDLLGNNRLEGSSIDLGAIEWGTILPVQVSLFTANLVNGRTQLKWNVGTEDNISRYEVERSQNGTDFVKVAEVVANGSTSYSTADNSPALGVNYYRLVTIDNDGTRKDHGQLQTVTLATLASEGVGVYPNPATGSEVNVNLGNAVAGTYGYTIVNTSGSVAQQGTLSYDGTSATVQVGSLPAGVYVLQFSNGAQAKLIKQ